MFIKGQSLYVAWLGDSQVVLCKAGQPYLLMDPHKPDREVWCNTGNLVEYINRLNLLLKYIPEVCTGPGKH